MISVQRPLVPTTSAEFFLEAAGKSRPLEKRTRLESVANAVKDAIDEYDLLARQQRLGEITPVTSDFEGVAKADFGSLYDSSLANRAATGRPYYDAIRLAPRGEICPFCGTRVVETVDHVLPKSHFPQFSIAFENLVGCCTDCNFAKLDSMRSEESELIFHPYYEDFSDRSWLAAEIIHEHPVRVVYKVIDTSTESARIHSHFKRLRLGRIFAIRAGSELSTMDQKFCEVLESGGSESLHDHLKSIADSAARQPLDPWKPALYIALAQDDWFCSGGFIETEEGDTA